MNKFIGMTLYFSFFAVSITLIERWRIRVDCKRLLFKWTTWSWDDFHSGRISTDLLSLYDPQKPFEKRRLIVTGMDAAYRRVLCMLAVERFRLDNDALPETLNDLAPKYIESIPLDPFDGNPLRYKKLETGYSIYSIGPDCIDDGGKSLTR